MRHRRAQQGSSLMEFVLAGIPMIFIWISIVQLALGMWHYHTLQYAVKAAGAFVAHRGAKYVAAGNSASQIQDAADVLAAAAIGMPPASLNVTFTSGATVVTCRLDLCQSNTTAFPEAATRAVGSEFTIRANYTFRSAIAMVAPGPGSGPVRFGTHVLPGYTRQMILF